MLKLFKCDCRYKSRTKEELLGTVKTTNKKAGILIYNSTYTCDKCGKVSEHLQMKLEELNKVT